MENCLSKAKETVCAYGTNPRGWWVQERGRWELGAMLEQWPEGGLRKAREVCQAVSPNPALHAGPCSLPGRSHDPRLCPEGRTLLAKTRISAFL